MSGIEPVGLWQAITRQALQPGQPDLTNRQTAILLMVHTEPGPHTVRGLAGQLGLGKPAVVRALDTLSAAGLLTRTPDPDDRRSVRVEPTRAGALMIADMSAAIAVHLARTIRAATAGASAPTAAAPAGGDLTLKTG